MTPKQALVIKRPYDSLESFLEGDAWTVDRAEIVLVGADALPEETSVRFEITLSSGPAIVVGEGRVTGLSPASEGRPAGVRVRLQKLNGASKDVLKRALEMQRRKGKAAPAPAVPASAPNASEKEPAAAPTPASEPEPVSLAAEGRANAPPEPVSSPEASGVRNRVGTAAAPENRDALLARLRERARTVKVEAFFEKKKAG